MVRRSVALNMNLQPNRALVSDACERRSRAFFSAAQRER
jgi:hypothetical protein